MLQSFLCVLCLDDPRLDEGIQLACYFVLLCITRSYIPFTSGHVRHGRIGTQNLLHFCNFEIVLLIVLCDKQTWTGLWTMSAHNAKLLPKPK